MSSFDFVLDYNPSLLDITAVAIDPSVQEPDNWTTNLYVTFNPVDATHEQLEISDYSDGSTTLAASSGAQQFVDLTANVPANVQTVNGVVTYGYGASELLHFEPGAQFTSPSWATIAVRTADGVHQDVYYGDANDDGLVNSSDTTLISRTAQKVLPDSGLYAEPLTDPVIIAGVDGSGVMTTRDAQIVSQYVTHPTTTPQVPAAGPQPGSGQFAGIDPVVQIGAAGTVAAAGATIETPVRVVGDPHGLASAQLTISYNPQLLSLSNGGVTLGQDLATDGWKMVSTVNQAAGTVSVNMWGAPLTTGMPELLDLAFQARDVAATGTSPLTISGTLNSNLLVMTPVDGSITVSAAAPVVAPAPAGGSASASVSAASVDQVLAQAVGTGEGSPSAAVPAASQNNVAALVRHGALESIDSLVAKHLSQKKKDQKAQAGNTIDAALLSMFWEGND
ncbi:MAG: cohesin domain-containing protein [Thermoguttaceae bacterium]